MQHTSCPPLREADLSTVDKRIKLMWFVNLVTH